MLDDIVYEEFSGRSACTVHGFYSKHIHSLLNDYAADVLPHWLDVIRVGGDGEVAVYLALASERLETPLDEVRTRLPLQGTCADGFQGVSFFGS